MNANKPFGLFLVLLMIPSLAVGVDLAPVGDATLASGFNGNNNYNGGGMTAGQGCPDWCESHWESLLQFDLSGVGSVTSATLRVYVYDLGTWGTSGVVYAHAVSDDSWNESTVTWNTAPGPDWTTPPGSAESSAGPLPGPGWAEFDLTTLAQQEAAGDGLMSVRLVPDGTYQHYALMRTKEWSDSGVHPYLQVTTSSAGEADPTLSSASGAPVGSIMVCPWGDGPSLLSLGMEIGVHVVDANGTPINGYPAQDIWWESAAPGVNFCVPATADQATNANGDAVISSAAIAGGSSSAGVRIMVGGQPLSQVMNYTVNSPDVDGNLDPNLIDVGLYAAAFPGPYQFWADLDNDLVHNLGDVAQLAAHLSHSCN